LTPSSNIGPRTSTAIDGLREGALHLLNLIRLAPLPQGIRFGQFLA
jgi:hypothetical protein